MSTISNLHRQTSVKYYLRGTFILLLVNLIVLHRLVAYITISRHYCERWINLATQGSFSYNDPSLLKQRTHRREALSSFTFQVPRGSEVSMQISMRTSIQYSGIRYGNVNWEEILLDGSHIRNLVSFEKACTGKSAYKKLIFL